MMTTSVFFRSAAIGTAFPEHREVVHGSMVRCHLRVHLLLACGYRGTHARVANQIPSDEVRVTTVIRVAERPLDDVAAHRGKEDRGGRWKSGCGAALHVGEQSILVRRGQLREGGT